MIYRISCDREKCSNCGRCEEHWPGIMEKFNGQGYFDLDERQMASNLNRFWWAFHLCPGKDGITEAISREVLPCHGIQEQ